MVKYMVKINKIDIEIDARNLNCPGPILLLSSKINNLPNGSVIKVLATDQAFESDIVAWCKSTGNKLIELSRNGREIVAYIMKQ